MDPAVPLGVVLVHGWLVDGRAWAPLAAALEQRSVRVLAPSLDLPDDKAAVYPAAIHQLEGLLNTIDGPVVVVGHSMGAAIAQALAVAQPERVAGLALVNPVPSTGLPLPPEVYATFAAFAGDEAALRGFFGGLVARRDQAFEVLIEAALQCSTEVARATLAAWTSVDAVPELERVWQRVSAPVRVLRGKEDPYLPREFLESTIVARIPGADLREIEGAAHYPHLDATDATAAELVEFFGRCQSSTLARNSG